jgi:hypothetical protein
VYLKDQSTDVNIAAADALGRLADRRAVGPLIDLLQSPGSRVRSNAVMALARLNDDQAIRHFGYDRVRNALLNCEGASKVDHIALMRIERCCFPPQILW